MYGNEKEVGNGIKNSGIDRSKLFVTTKFCSPNTTYDLVISGMKESLKNLQLSYLDLVLIHEPYASSIEMYKALEDLQAKGLIKHIGVSNFNRKQIDNLLNNCTVMPYVNQICVDISKITNNRTICEIAQKQNASTNRLKIFTPKRYSYHSKEQKSKAFRRKS